MKKILALSLLWCVNSYSHEETLSKTQVAKEIVLAGSAITAGVCASTLSQNIIIACLKPEQTRWEFVLRGLLCGVFGPVQLLVAHRLGLITQTKDGVILHPALIKWLCYFNLGYQASDSGRLIHELQVTRAPMTWREQLYTLSLKDLYAALAIQSGTKSVEKLYQMYSKKA